MARLRKWLRHARERLWAAIKRRHKAKPHSAERKKWADKVEARREVKDDLIRKIERRKNRKIDFSPGKPHWGGSMDIIVREVIPLADGIPVTSLKRSETYGNPGSDHHTSQVLAAAVDFGTANNYALRDRIAVVLCGHKVSDYEYFYFYRGGKRFRGQIIAGTHGTGPHLHCGIRRA